MALLPLLGGFYTARGLIAGAQRCVNLYPEINPKDSPTPVTCQLTPGLTLLQSGPLQLPWRGLYFANNGQLFGVLGGIVYLIGNNFALTPIGAIPTRFTPVSMVDNGSVLVLVDGSSSGWSYTFNTATFTQITDPNFQGGDFVTYIDGFFILNVPGSQAFYTSLANSLTFSGLYTAAKSGSADNLVAIAAVHRELWLIGARTSEVWSDAGNPTGVSFSPIPGVFLQHGCAAKYSVAQYNLQLFWLSQDNNGQALVLEGSNYAAKDISTPALSEAIRKYEVISDAIGFIYQQDNHVFYVLSFPSANKTWSYDLTTQLWHERVYIDSNGNEGRIRANCTAFAYGQNVVGDWQNGNLYSFDLDNATDNGNPVIRRRGFPHAVKDGKLVFHNQFIARFQTGNVPEGVGSVTQQPNAAAQSAPQNEPEVFLRWSDDRGNSWGIPVEQSLGATGQYNLRPSWRDLGQTDDRVYELFWSDPAMTALDGAWVDSVPLAV